MHLSVLPTLSNRLSALEYLAPLQHTTGYSFLHAEFVQAVSRRREIKSETHPSVCPCPFTHSSKSFTFHLLHLQDPSLQCHYADRALLLCYRQLFVWNEGQRLHVSFALLFPNKEFPVVLNTQKKTLDTSPG